MIALEKSLTTAPSGRKRVTISFELPEREDGVGPLDIEQGLQRALNEIGQHCLTHALASFDTQGEPISVGKIDFTSKGTSPQVYASLFGPITLHRHLYQSSDGGRTYCPLEQDARIRDNATLGLAQVLASKFANQTGRSVQRDMLVSHQLTLQHSRIEDISAAVGEAALHKEAHWKYKAAIPKQEVAAITVYVDGTCVPIVDENYKQAMVGVIDLLGYQGERLHSVFVAGAPEDKKASFFGRLERELEDLAKLYPEAPRVGLSDGAPDLQEWLEAHCHWVTLDFYHLSQYVHSAAAATQADDSQRAQWAREMLHKLKNWKSGKNQLRSQLRKALSNKALSAEQRESVETALGYVERNFDRLDYKEQLNLDLPIGSGVVEAACKHIVKARLCGCGMRWTREGMRQVLILRTLQESSGRWEQFWNKVQLKGW